MMKKPGVRKASSERPAGKVAKVQLRLRPDQKAVLARAARLRQTNLSDFMLSHAYAAAQEVLAEQLDIVLAPAEWRAFCKALDAPPRGIPALRKLLTEASVFDGERNASAR
jgi:uncharacterized protein (DUF1778 family)